MKNAVARWRRKPFVRLAEHFFDRFFETGAVTRDPYSRLGIAPALGLLAAPGAIMSLILFLKYSPLARWFSGNFKFDYDLAPIPDKYTFIVFSMTATGIVSVLKWESLFPDRRDFANLAPLPVSTPAVFFAKMIALISFAFVFAVDLNAVSSLLFPMIAMESTGTVDDIARFIAAHAASVVAASAFAFCAFVALAGLLMNLLPYAAFRRVTRYLQFIVITVLLLMFLLTPLTTPGLLRVRSGIESVHVWLPPVWFLGLSESLHGKATPAFEALAGRALQAFGLVAVIAALAYAGAYRRYFLKTAEMPEIVGSARRFPDWTWRMLDAALLRTPFERGCFRFAVKTLFRSDRHNTVLAAFLAIGAALAVQACVLPAKDPGLLGVTNLTLSGSLTMLYFLITGLRFCFGISHEERANWLFQTAVSDRAPDARGVTRKIILLFTACVLVASIPIYTALAGIAVAFFHAVYAALLSILLIELLLMDMRTIPFTCTYLPRRDNVVLAVMVYFVGFGFFAHVLATFEYWLLTHPYFAPIFAAAVTGALLALRHLREANQQLEYEQPPGDLQLLRLSE